jgi:hypothetical protein
LTAAEHCGLLGSAQVRPSRPRTQSGVIGHTPPGGGRWGCMPAPNPTERRAPSSADAPPVVPRAPAGGGIARGARAGRRYSAQSTRGCSSTGAGRTCRGRHAGRVGCLAPMVHEQLGSVALPGLVLPSPLACPRPTLLLDRSSGGKPGTLRLGRHPSRDREPTPAISSGTGAEARSTNAADTSKASATTWRTPLTMDTTDSAMSACAESRRPAPRAPNGARDPARPAAPAPPGWCARRRWPSTRPAGRRSRGRRVRSACDRRGRSCGAA